MTAKKVALVTGADSGLGYEVVKALLQSSEPHHVVLGSKWMEKAHQAARTLEKDCQTSNTVQVVYIDLNYDVSIANAYQTVKKSLGTLDVLINNAGACFDHLLAAGKMSLRQVFMEAYDINVAGNNVVATTFMPLLLKSADPRLIFVTGLSEITKAAEAYYPTPPLPAGWPKTVDFETIGYRCSKTAQNMMMVDWNHKLKADGVKVWSVHPGFLATGLGGLTEEIIKQRNADHPSVGAKLILDVVEGRRDADVGRIVGRGGLMPF